MARYTVRPYSPGPLLSEREVNPPQKPRRFGAKKPTNHIPHDNMILSPNRRPTEAIHHRGGYDDFRPSPRFHTSHTRPLISSPTSFSPLPCSIPPSPVPSLPPPRILPHFPSPLSLQTRPPDHTHIPARPNVCQSSFLGGRATRMGQPRRRRRGRVDWRVGWGVGLGGGEGICEGADMSWCVVAMVVVVGWMDG